MMITAVKPRFVGHYLKYFVTASFLFDALIPVIYEAKGILVRSTHGFFIETMISLFNDKRSLGFGKNHGLINPRCTGICLLVLW